MHADRFRTASLNDPRIGRILTAALDAVDPSRLVTATFNRMDLPRHDHVYMLGLGKAAAAMTMAAIAAVPDFVRALIITKHALIQSQTSDTQASALKRTAVIEAGHPIPDSRSLTAGHAALRFVSNLGAGDLLICLLSGGGSALATVPAHGLGLSDLKQLTSDLLSSGASIEEANILRRQLDRLKGGGLAGATKAIVLSLILSDVPEDRLEAIASGPTAPNPTTAADAREIMRRYRIPPSPAIERALSFDSPIPKAVLRGRVQNLVIGNNQLAVEAAAACAKGEGFDVEIWERTVRSEARRVGPELAGRLERSLGNRSRPYCLVAGGETTVRVAGDGKGGRNQELALSAVDKMAGIERSLLVSLATDGEDGPTDAAGAVVTQKTRSRALALGLSVDACLRRNDAYPFFDALADLIRIGPTGTNVNDLILLAGI